MLKIVNLLRGFPKWDEFRPRIRMNCICCSGISESIMKFLEKCYSQSFENHWYILWVPKMQAIRDTYCIVFISISNQNEDGTRSCCYVFRFLFLWKSQRFSDIIKRFQWFPNCTKNSRRNSSSLRWKNSSFPTTNLADVKVFQKKTYQYSQNLENFSGFQKVEKFT